MSEDQIHIEIKKAPVDGWYWIDEYDDSGELISRSEVKGEISLLRVLCRDLLRMSGVEIYQRKKRSGS